MPAAAGMSQKMCQQQKNVKREGQPAAQGPSYSASAACELSAELSLVRRTWLLLRHREELFGDALRAEWCSRLDEAANCNRADANALRLELQSKTSDKIAQRRLADTKR